MYISVYTQFDVMFNSQYYMVHQKQYGNKKKVKFECAHVYDALCLSSMFTSLMRMLYIVRNDGIDF